MDQVINVDHVIHVDKGLVMDVDMLIVDVVSHVIAVFPHVPDVLRV